MENHHLILHIRISLDSKFQLQQTIFSEKLAQSPISLHLFAEYI